MGNINTTDSTPTQSNITKEKIQLLYETMKKNVTLVNDWNSRLMESCEGDKWTDTVLERSKVLHQVFEENEKNSKEFWDSLPPRLYGEEIDLLFDLMYKIHEESIYVVSFGLRLARLLLPYFEEKQAYDKIVFLNYFMGHANYLLFDRTLNTEGPSDWLEYFEKVLSYEEHYTEIENEEFRSIFFSSYLNLMQYSCNYPSLKGRTHEFHEKAKALWNREDVQTLDGTNPLIKTKLTDIENQYLSLLSFNPDLIEDPDAYCAMAEQSLKKIGRVNIKSDPTGYYKILESNVKRLKKQVSDEACVTTLSDYIVRAIPPISFEKKEENRSLQMLMNEHSTFFYALKLMQTLPEDKQHLLDNALLRIVQDDIRVPYAFYRDDTSWIFYQLYSEAAHYIQNEESKLKLLKNIILCRQPLAYIHSCMVASLAKMIGESVIAHKPELFTTLEGYADIKAVKNGRDSLLATIERCGMLHDVGKCRVAIVINAQDRKLTESEYGILKYHPQMGEKLLEKDEALKTYLDVIVGHHKTYNGDGYPAQFDNTASPVRILIDLIAIADGMDAGTDILGRYYSQGKDFKKLLEELKEGAGKRYNPDLVTVIAEDKDLQENISELTSTGRLSLYQKSYVDIINMHKNTEIKSLS